MTTLIIINLITILLVLKPITKANNFTTLFEIETLMETQFKIVKSLQHFVAKEKKRIHFLETYLKRCKAEYSRAIEDVPHYLGNPINAFTLIKRLSGDLEYVENIIKDRSGYKRNITVKYPDKEDLDAAVFGFARLQTTYHLNISSLASGVLSASFNRDNKSFKETVTPLSASDCFYIGNVSFTHGYYKEATEWWIQAFYKFYDEGCDLCPFSESEVIDKITHAYYIIGDIDSTIEWVNKRISIGPDDPETVDHIQFANALKRRLDKQRKEIKDEGIQIIDNHEHFKGFMDLCQGKADVLSPLPLSCMFAKGVNPSVSLMRIKMEQMHRQADITMIHDVISHDEIRNIFEQVKTKTFINGPYRTMKNSEAGYRNAKSVNLEPGASEVAERYAKRLELVTGIKMEHSEPLKINNYGIGGYYEPHFDCHTVRTPPNDYFAKHGDRVATVLTYLSNVALGGATIFPKLGLTIFPKKGAALFWRNLLPSADKDDDLYHAACPVIRGSKWISIKWPHEVPQKQCPVWRTRRGLMTDQMYQEFFTEIEYLRKEKQKQKKLERESGPLLNKRIIRNEL